MILNPYLMCLLIKDVLKKYKITNYEIKKGYLVFEKYYFTFFWLESGDGNKIDPNELDSSPYTEYIFQEDIPEGYECIDDVNIVSDTVQYWNSGKYPKEILSKKNEILKKHPNKVICKNV